LPLPLTGSALTAWLAEEHVSKALIGLLALFECPFAIKPILWPLINRFSIPFLTPRLGRRKSWALVSFCGAIVLLAMAALLTPTPHLILFYVLIAGICLFSGCIYLIGIAYEIESLSIQQYSEGSACVIFGYRLGLVTAGAGTLYIAHFYSWTTAYLVICAVMSAGTFCLLFAQEPPYTPPTPAIPEKLVGISWYKKIWGLLIEDLAIPILELVKRREWQWILIFLCFYRMGDYLVEGMVNPFFLDLGYTKADIANAAKLCGMIATVLGALCGAVVSSHMGLERALAFLGLVHAGRFAFYLVLIHIGPNLPVFMVAEAFQHFSGGMIMTVFIAALWRLTTPGKAAPQYALLWSAISLKSKLFAFFGGLLANYLSWDLFFFIALVVSLLASLLPLGLPILQKPTPELSKGVTG